MAETEHVSPLPCLQTWKVFIDVKRQGSLLDEENGKVKGEHERMQIWVMVYILPGIYIILFQPVLHCIDDV